MPAERLENAAATLVRASLGPPVRDLATTRAGTVQYALARRAPRRLLDRLTLERFRALARRGHFGQSRMARDFVARWG